VGARHRVDYVVEPASSTNCSLAPTGYSSPAASLPLSQRQFSRRFLSKRWCRAVSIDYSRSLAQ